MAAVKYTCPKCKATLRPARAVPAGKKIKCPKCETVFAPPASAAEEVAVQPAAAVSPASGGAGPADEDELETYGFLETPATPEQAEEQARRKKKRKKEEELSEAFDPIKDVDREPRSLK